MRSIDYRDAWAAWWAGRKVDGFQFWGLPMVWWGRIGKVVHSWGHRRRADDLKLANLPHDKLEAVLSGMPTEEVERLWDVRRRSVRRVRRVLKVVNYALLPVYVLGSATVPQPLALIKDRGVRMVVLAAFSAPVVSALFFFAVTRRATRPVGRRSSWLSAASTSTCPRPGRAG
ncbi:hypothetical protein ABZ816_29975 [Actinosynnema sp. NPDC047251]|uniref:Putative membrane protein n=1 Tax=Saccharothrix espanaensis (strain ATCC 51144 / DSM 44229 / JCM 9112 / NBRC 15066 / NRRL 15764) TaxID=1179773 RepID=K0K8J3_SACES|nr:hypothetical protein [Saccharothrix espanaensis]CCH34691.1 putative membrane protein [Saccharothrix espanaensis DSM 44229]